MFFLLLSIFMFVPTALSTEAAVDITREDFNGRSFGQLSYWYIGNEDIETISAPIFKEKFTQGLNERLSFGTSQPIFWMKTVLLNPLPTKQNIFILDSSSYAEDVSIYRDKQLIRSFSHNDHLRNRVAELELEPNSSTPIYIKRLAYGSQRQTWTFWLDREIVLHDIRDSERNWALTMAIFAMSLMFNMMLYISYRLKLYLYYIGYILSWATWSSFIWSMMGSFYSVPLILLLSYLSQVFVALFTMDFLNLRKEFPKSYLFLKFLIFASILTSPLCFYDAFLSFKLGVFINGPGSLGLFLIAAIVYFRKKEFHVLIYLVAYGAFLSGVMVLTAIWKGLLPGWAAYVNLTFYLAAIENILMLVAMGYRIYGTEKERIKNHKDLKHSYNQLAKVFYPHQLSAIRSGKSLEKTMPIDNKKAAVIAFDVIESSKVEFEGFKDALEIFFGKCRGAIFEEYNQESMTANGYIIKEMGDGLLCSVGFPFKAPRNDQKCLCAVELAERFVKEFIDTIDSFSLSEPIYCAVGIAYDSVEGFFSESGVVKYDLFGKALVLATRYESSRKEITEKMNIEDSNLIILQQKVYESLPVGKKKEYLLIDVKESGMNIRGDESATHVAIRKIKTLQQLKSAS